MNTRQNGVVRRKCKHIFLEVCTALLFQSHLPLWSCENCSFTTTYLINLVEFKSHYIMWPSRVFNRLCYMSTTKQKKDKLPNTVVPYVFLRCPLDKKSYKLFITWTQPFYFSRDVHEFVFPYSKAIKLCFLTFQIITLIILLPCHFTLQIL